MTQSRLPSFWRFIELKKTLFSIDNPSPCHLLQHYMCLHITIEHSVVSIDDVKLNPSNIIFYYRHSYLNFLLYRLFFPHNVRTNISADLRYSLLLTMADNITRAILLQRHVYINLDVSLRDFMINFRMQYLHFAVLW